MSCPSDDDLAAHLAGELDADAVQAIAEHLDGCDACRAIVAAMVKDAAPPTPDTRSRAPATVAATKQARRRGPHVSVGGMIDRYRVLRLLGQGGMGMVYAAHDTELDRQVAVKVMRPELGDAVADRLVRESRLMAKVAHPAVITVFDSGRAGEQVWVAMEYIEGSTLGGWLHAAPRTWLEIVEMFRRAGEGLGAAHKAGLVHRDFKPENVLLALDGDRVARVVVTDLGVARAITDVGATGATPAPMTPIHVSLTATGVAVGTPAYMAPEQLDAKEVDARADVFAFGVALWEALWGERPFPGRSVPEIRNAIDRGPRPPPAQPRARGASDRPPAWIERTLRAAVSADPAHRPASMADLLARLDPARHHRRVRNAAIVGVLGVGAVAAGVVAVVSRADGRAVAPDAAPAPTTLAVCTDPFDPPWGDDAKRSLRSLIEAAPSPVAVRIADRAIAGMDAYAGRWRTVRDQVCAQPRAIAEVGAACLEVRKAQLGNLLAVLPDVPIEERAKLDQTLVFMPGHEVCATAGAAGVIAALTTASPAAQATRAEIDAAIARVDAGDVVGGGAALEALRAEVDGLDEPALSAAYYHELARVYAETGSTKVAETLRLALASAEKARLDELSASIWIDLAGTLADTDLDEAMQTLQLADAAIVRAGGDPVLRVTHDHVLASIHFQRNELDDAERISRAALDTARAVAPEMTFDLQVLLADILNEAGKYGDALALHRGALPDLERLFGPDHPLVASAHADVAADLVFLGDAAGVLTELETALAIAERAYGPDELEAATYRTALADALRNVGRYEDAVAMLRATREILVTHLGPDDALVAGSMESEAGALEGIGKWKEAAALLRQALAIYRAGSGDDSADTATCRINLAEALRRLHKLPEAVSEGRAGLAVLSTIHGDDHPFVAYARAELGKSLLDQKKVGEATMQLEAALDTFARAQMDPAVVADVQLTLAKALTAAAKGAAPARAADLAAQAIAALADAGPAWADELAEARAWVAAHHADGSQ